MESETPNVWGRRGNDGIGGADHGNTPRAWGRHIHHRLHGLGHRNTTCEGKTEALKSDLETHVRGEDQGLEVLSSRPRNTPLGVRKTTPASTSRP